MDRNARKLSAEWLHELFKNKRKYAKLLIGKAIASLDRYAGKSAPQPTIIHRPIDKLI
jgi:hypothetical protein